jgi:hypothetical protein
MEQFDVASLAGIQKSNGPIHERNAIEIQRNPRLITSYLSPHFIEMFRAQPTGQVNDRLSPIGNLFQSSMSFAISTT